MEILEPRGTSVVIFTETELRGAYEIDHGRLEDTRGLFARTFRQHELEARGLKPVIAQADVGYNRVELSEDDRRALSSALPTATRCLSTTRRPRTRSYPPNREPSSLVRRRLDERLWVAAE